ncbi:MAG: AraC family transcriptional regulator, partial [Clostridia bacterium]
GFYWDLESGVRLMNEAEVRSMGLSEIERKYKALYMQNPSAYDRPVSSWRELSERFESVGNFNVPPSPYSIIDDVLTEEEFFRSHRDIRCFTNARYGPAFLHRLEFIKIVYVLSGNAILYLDGKRYKLAAGSFCIITPGVEQAVFSNSDEDVVVNLLMRFSTFTRAFSGLMAEKNVLADFFRKIMYTSHSSRVLLFTCSNDMELDNVVIKIFLEDGNNDSISNLIMKNYLTIFLGVAVRSHISDLTAVEELSDGAYHLPAIIQYIKENIKTATIKALSERFHVNEEYMNRYIACESGYSFHALLKDMRLKKAAQLLKNTDISVEKAAEEVGFSDIAGFYKQFRIKFGVAPGKYQQNN